ncbi:LIM/homeobox protein Lhx3-like [Microplitis mediator]|uniref:LIM/homeobox protein Lhx3-like n=1 Tax=Microplitis mediator TaxID=375433 RepID=UPI002555EF65|nr:LIM/homeobox protein Lhx3-like [Microplitis mediator]XP_057324989.1 LIM/homeobox protein Lhx3-like [Microplitis mediator]XP_057324990.1 LIM/homeobox protein Lhx3-like [Microplitis mediator]
MNPHHPGHSAAYPHHPSLSSSPHHPGAGGPHHGGYGTPGSGNSGGGAGGASSGAGSNSTSTPDLPSPHSPLSHSGQGDPGTPYGSMSGTPGMGSNGHLHGGGGMMGDNPHHSVHTHPHLPGHPAYPPVNHNNNNCTLKQEGPAGATNMQFCAGCNGRIVERFLLHAMDRYWHNSCLKCNCCHLPLIDLGASCYLKNNMILCKSDYMRLYCSGACHSCGSPIPGNELVMRAGGLVFHQKCFACSKCGNQLVAGDKYCLLSGAPICETDWQKMVKSSNVSAAAAAVTGNGGTTVRKAKVGRPRRSRE